MKRIAIADIHLTGYEHDDIQKDGLPLRLSNLIKSIKAVCQYAVKNNIEHIDILGDLCNDKDIVYTTAINAFIDLITFFSQLKFTIFSGNHDLSSTGETQTSTIKIFSQTSNVKCVYNTTRIENIDIIPYSNQLISELNSHNGGDILLSHFGLNEAQLQSGISVRTNISAKDLKKWKLVILGHYHKSQTITVGDTHIWYVGSPFHSSWNDKNETKRFLVYDTDTLKVASLDIGGTTKYLEYIIDDSTENSGDILKEAVENRKKGHFVRVINRSTNREFLHEDTDISSDVKVINEEIPVSKDRGINVSMTQLDIFKKFVEIKQISENKRDMYINTITEVLSNKGL